LTKKSPAINSDRVNRRLQTIMRILGITIPDDKRLEIGLTSLYGIGRNKAKETLSLVGIEHGKRAKDLTDKEEVKLRTELESYRIEGDLKREVTRNVKRLKDIGSYRGSRHTRNLPAKGQRTKTNSRTVRGNKRNTMGSGRKAVEKK
ncbi:MAG: 30S ribosomal protein S13, partial [Candidatus Paceibacterota bacterium]